MSFPGSVPLLVRHSGSEPCLFGMSLPVHSFLLTIAALPLCISFWLLSDVNPGIAYRICVLQIVRLIDSDIGILRMLLFDFLFVILRMSFVNLDFVLLVKFALLLSLFCPQNLGVYLRKLAGNVVVSMLACGPRHFSNVLREINILRMSFVI